VEIGKKTVAEKERTEGDVPLRATIYLSGEKKRGGGGGGGGKKSRQLRNKEREVVSLSGRAGRR